MTPPDDAAPAPAQAEGNGTAAPEAAGKPSLLGAVPKPEEPKGTEQPGAGAGKPADAAAWTPKLPEGVEVAPESVETIKGLGLPAEKAQAVLDAAVKWQAAQGDAAMKAWEEQGQTWFTELQNDKEFGGKAFAANQVAAQRAVLKFGGPAFARELQERGLDNFPPFAKFLAAVGKSLGEDSLAGTSGEPSRTPANDEEAFKRAMFPTMYPKEG